MPTMLIVWILVFILSILVLVKSADWFIDSGEKIGLKVGMSPFIVGVTIIAFGTSFPELMSSLAAMIAGVPEIIPASAIGSNVANIFLIVGISVLVARQLAVSTDLIDLDLPLITIATSIFVVVAWDGVITRPESVFLLMSYAVYLIFSILYQNQELTPERVNRRKIKLVPTDFVLLVFSAVGLAMGAKGLIDSIIQLSSILNIQTAVITITAVAIGTSLPELIVSVRAALDKKAEIALGNIFGSNVFNVLVVVGLPGLLGVITLDEKTLTVGLPMLILATILFLVSGISRRIHMQEGILYLMLYILFIVKLFGWF